MNDMSFYTTLKIGWLNAWIPILLIIIVQAIYALFYKEGTKRATNISFYTKKDRMIMKIATAINYLLLIVAVFIPLKIGTVWFTIGAILYTIAIIIYFLSFHTYVNSPMDKMIQRGIYHFTRNPMYVGFDLSLIAVSIASASIWLSLFSIVLIVISHPLILKEEQYCEKVYGEEYVMYKNKTPRYLFF